MGPISDADRAELLSAKRRGRALRRGALTARISASISAFFSVACLLWFLAALAFGSFDLWSLVLAIGLGGVAWNEFRGATQLVACAPGAPRRLALGQVFLGGLIITYCAWALHAALTGPSFVTQAQTTDPQVAEMLAPYEELAEMIAVGVYGGAIVLTVVFQGCGALYYLSKRKALRAFVDATPEWIVDLERARAGERRAA